jgi:hypothetical protein
MSCPSVSKCWIVGFSSSDSPILALWNGSSFVQGHLRASAAYLDGVGCTETRCVAIGLQAATKKGTNPVIGAQISVP